MGVVGGGVGGCCLSPFPSNALLSRPSRSCTCSSSCWLSCCLECFFHCRTRRGSFHLLLTGNIPTRREEAEQERVGVRGRRGRCEDFPFNSPEHAQAGEKTWRKTRKTFDTAGCELSMNNSAAFVRRRCLCFSIVGPELY